MMENLVPDVGAFLLGAPKSGTTWLANVLEQHPGICISNPKEPNEVATHRGTFGRNIGEPDWERYAGCFRGEGLKMDCSVHAFACPVAPSRVVKHWPKARFVVCLREPRRRTISHWGMVLDTEEDNQNGADWSDFASAWRDERLSCDTLYGSCMERWLGNFSRDRFLLIDSGRMRNESRAVLAEILEHLGMDAYDFDMTEVHNANTAMDRRPLTLFGRGFRFAAALIPGFLKQPLVSSLQGKGVNVYKLPIISKARPTRAVPTPEQCVEMNDEVTGDIEKLERITSFPVKQWLDSAQ